MKHFKNSLRSIGKLYQTEQGKQNYSADQQKSRFHNQVDKYADYLNNEDPDNEGGGVKHNNHQNFEQIKKSKQYQEYMNMIKVENQYDRYQRQEKLDQQIKKKREAQDTEQRTSTPGTESSGIPFMITKQMKLDLFEMGFSVEQIKRLSPMQANEILTRTKKDDK